MGTIGSVLVLLLCAAAFAAMFGATKTAGRLVTWVVVLAFVAGFLPGIWAIVGGVLDQILPGAGLGGVGAVVILVLFGIAIVRFINHRRRLEKWLVTRSTSQKRRVERE